MTRTDPPGRHPLPGSEVPSAEVLDELLRAFSVDVTDQQGMDRVDLGSPEVVELLAPPADVSPVDADAVTVVWSSSNRSQVIAVSKVSERTPQATKVSRR